MLREVLHYIYTARVQIATENIFEAFTVGLELGFDELASVCHKLLSSSITSYNVFAFLEEALLTKSRLGGKKPSLCKLESKQKFSIQNKQTVADWYSVAWSSSVRMPLTVSKRKAFQKGKKRSKI